MTEPSHQIGEAVVHREGEADPETWDAVDIFPSGVIHCKRLGGRDKWMSPLAWIDIEEATPGQHAAQEATAQDVAERYLDDHETLGDRIDNLEESQV